jgi:hypothetical protein
MSSKNETRDAMISDEDILAFQDPEIDRKARTLSTSASARSPILGPIFTSVSQKKRYITIDYTVSVTSYQETQWLNFALKDDSYEFFLVNYPDVTEHPSQLSPSTSDTAFRT